MIENTIVAQKYPFAFAASLLLKNRINGIAHAERIILITEAPVALYAV